MAAPREKLNGCVILGDWGTKEMAAMSGRNEIKT